MGDRSEAWHIYNCLYKLKSHKMFFGKSALSLMLVDILGPPGEKTCNNVMMLCMSAPEE